MSSMRAAQLVGPGRFDIREVPVPVPGPDQVLVRLIGSSICGSDLHVVYDEAFLPPLPAPPGFPGHEGVGVVEDSRHPGFTPGDLVLAVPHAATFTCFADLHLADATHLIGLPADGDPWRLLMAQQLGTVVYAMKHFVPAPVSGGTAVVVGAGSAGHFFAQLVRAAGYHQVIVSEPAAPRRHSALDLGVDLVIDPASEPLAALVADRTAGRGADLVIDAAGTVAARQDAVACAAERATVGLFGYPHHPELEPFPLAPAWRKMLSLVACVYAQREPELPSFRTAVDLLSAGTVRVDSLLSGPVLGLGDIEAAFERARSGSRDKVVLRVGEST